MTCQASSIEFQYYFYLSCSMLSLICCTYVICVCIYFKLLEGLSFKIVFYIAINDSIRALVIAIPIRQYHLEHWCDVFGFIISSIFLSTIVWASCICVTLYQIMIKETSHYERYHKVWLGIAYGLVPAIQALPIITDSYSLDTGLCSLEDTTTGNLWRLCIIYVPAWALIVLALVVFIKVYLKLKTEQTQAMKSIILDRGFIYVLLVILILIPMTCLRISEALLEDCPLEYFAIFSYGLISLHGFLNFLAFSSNKVVRTTLTGRNNLATFLDVKNFLTGSSLNSHKSEHEISLQKS